MKLYTGVSVMGNPMVMLVRFTGCGDVVSGSEWSTGWSKDSLQSTMAVSCSGSVRAESSHWGI